MTTIYRAFADGVSVQNMPDDYEPVDGDVIFDHVPSSSELAAAFVNYDTAIAAANLQKQIINTLASGFNVESTSHPEINSIYGMGDAIIANILSIVNYINQNKKLPSGKETFGYMDMSGSIKQFDLTTFLNFATAIQDYYYTVLAGTFPAQPTVIA